MNCTGFEHGITRLLVGEASADERQTLLADLRQHVQVCAECSGAGDLIEFLELPDGERDLVEPPDRPYWDSFHQRVRERIRADRTAPRWPARPHWALLAASLLVVALGLWGATRLIGLDPGEDGRDLVDVTDREWDEIEQLLAAASHDALADELAALPDLGSDRAWAAGEYESPFAADDGGWMLPEIEELGPDERRRLLEWLVEEYGFGRWDAYQLVGQLGESTVANIVDPAYTVVAKFPKEYLPR